MFKIVLLFHALAAFGSPTLAGWISFAATAPGLAFSPLAGAFLDRTGAARGIAVDLASSAILTFLLAVAIWLDRASPSVILLLAVAYALTSPLSAAGIRTLLPRLVPPHALPRANAVDTALHGIADVLGPSFAGLLIGFAGAEWAFLVIAFLSMAATLCLARVRDVQSPHRSHRGFFRQALDGLVEVVRRPLLRVLAVGYALNLVTWGILVVAVPVYIARRFPAGTWETVSGLVWAGASIAGGFGALIAGRWLVPGREVSMMASCMLATAFAMAIIGGGFGIVGLVVGLAVARLLQGPIDVGVLTLRQRRTPPDRLGRVLAVSMSLNMSGFSIGTALGGMLVAWSLPLAFAAATLASLLAAIVTARIPAHDDPEE